MVFTRIAWNFSIMVEDRAAQATRRWREIWWAFDNVMCKPRQYGLSLANIYRYELCSNSDRAILRPDKHQVWKRFVAIQKDLYQSTSHSISSYTDRRNLGCHRSGLGNSFSTPNDYLNLEGNVAHGGRAICYLLVQPDVWTGWAKKCDIRAV